MQGIDCGAKAVRETVASKVISDLEMLAARAEKVCCIVAEKTNSVTLCSPPSPAGIEKDPRTSEMYPPLFDRIRELSQNINCSLSGIEDTMRRCEL